MNHSVFLVCIYCLGRGLELDMPFLDYVTVFPVINSIAAIPLTPGGIGTRENAAVYILGALGVPEAQAFSVSILIYGTILTWALFGGIVYMIFVFFVGKPEELKREIQAAKAQR